MKEKTEVNPLQSESVFRLMVKFAVPSILGMLVSSFYNIVDQLFIGHAVGIDGNTATNVAFPFTTACTALALLFGIGGASHQETMNSQCAIEKAIKIIML